MDHIKTPKVDNVRLEDVSSTLPGVKGTLHLTTTHLIFVDPNGTKETWILYSQISEVEKLPLTARGSAVRVRTRTFRHVKFVITRDRECTDVFDTIQKLSSPTKTDELYAFVYNPKHIELTQEAGWTLYDPIAEYDRMEVPKSLWTRSKLNENYKLCETYPNTLYFPSSVSAPLIKECAQFRSKSRLPALSYYNKKAQTALCRCAQPMAGLNNRCPEDEAMLQAIIKSTPGTSRMYIVDTRPKINAMANRAAGKGYENVAHYENIDFHFIGIENIHVMRQSLQKLIEVFDTKDLSMSSYLRGLEESGWFKHIKNVLDTSMFIARAVYYEKRSVLVHCSDGWDRTAQTCSMAQIMLDPYYRTIHGFQVLVEKEWLSFGHKFVHRYGLLSGDPKEVSPIFTQFLEACWQLTLQFPTGFQFNERFLLDLHEHLYSCQFGTFLGNCEKERKDSRLNRRTYSLWGYMWQNLPDYINPFYKEGLHGVLNPSSHPQQFRFWRSLYNRYVDKVHPRESIADRICSLNDHNDSLRDHIRFLEKKIEKLATKDKEATSKNENEIENESSETTTTTTTTTANDTSTEESGSKDQIDHVTSSGSNDDVNDTEAVMSFVVEWDSFRGVHQCSCCKPVDSLSRKYHCWNCGKVFCAECVNKSSELPGHYSGNQVPVCKICYKKLRK
ncbi:myotubularin-related protein 6-like [Clytia hemisphaerica]|uniref:phosphatidylinositol-3,5-bisphosphate 3-phosphatase n=1 Tax=Clytia hemisphaerica TaxID=252671 RepID=A0A7M5VFW6_9CNID